jgi:hypothetical protein
VTYLSNEQYKVFCRLVKDTSADESEILRAALKDYMQSVGSMIYDNFEWPDNDPEHGGKREGAGYPKGKPRKSGGRKPKVAT